MVFLKNVMVRLMVLIENSMKSMLWTKLLALCKKKSLDLSMKITICKVKLEQHKIT